LHKPLFLQALTVSYCFQGRRCPILKCKKWLGIKLSADSLVWGNMILLYFLIALGVVFLIAEGVQRYLARRRD
jgi:hypothetical protein